jgi:hypothetical protein
MFYEALFCSAQRRAIGLAESYDDGVTWRGLGSMLSSKSQDAMRRPSVFTYKNEVFMVTDSKHGVKLHRCLKFPMSWHLNATLTITPLRGVSIIKVPTPQLKNVEEEEIEEKWIMVGSLSTNSKIVASSSSTWLGRRGSRGSSSSNLDGKEPIEDDVIAVYVSSSPLGPWKRHQQSPFRVHAASPGGGLAVLPNVNQYKTSREDDSSNSSSSSNSLIIRLGRSCSGGPHTCSDVVANTFELTQDTLQEKPLSLPPHQNFLGERVWRQGDGWDGGERAHATVAALPSGKVAAIVLGTPSIHIRPWYAFVLESILVLLHMAVAGCAMSLVAMVVLKKGGRKILKSYKTSGNSNGVNSGGGNGYYRREATVSPSGNASNLLHGGLNSGGGSATSLPGGNGYTPKASSLAIQRLQAEERGEIHQQPISPRGRAVLTSRGPAAARIGSGEAASSSSSTSTGGVVLAAELATRFATFATKDGDNNNNQVGSPSSSHSPKGYHLPLNTTNYNHHHSPAAPPPASSPLSNNNNNNNNTNNNNNVSSYRRRRHQLRLAIRGAIQRWAIRLLEATPRQIVSFLTAFLAISSVSYGLGRIHTLLYPFWAPAPALEVGGQFTRFTLLVMSYESRRSLLEGYIRNYQQCSSVGEILIVWNQQQRKKDADFPPPDPLRDFPWATVPIRVRSHANNSLSNRYLPDDQLRYRGVLSLDDDLRLPCVDIERAFASWRSSPSSLTGFVARLAEVSTSPRYQTEPEAVAKGWYNIILTGAAFIDSRIAFGAFWSDSKPMQQARALVDQVFNCDDILMNFVVSNMTVQRVGKKGKKQGSVLFVRPSRRLDVSFLSGVGLSHRVDHFLDDAENCLKEFEKLFGRWPLRAEEFHWDENPMYSAIGRGGGGKPRCRKGRSHLDCSFLS